MMNAEVHLKGPYAVSGGLSYITLGELLQGVREQGPGRYPVMNANGETFHLVLYEDSSWRISTPQLELFPDQKATSSPHTLT